MPVAGKKILGRVEVIVFLAALAVLAALLLRGGDAPSGQIAYLSVRGEQVMALDLSTASDQVISLREAHGVPAELEIRDGKIRFINVECPDHTCMRTGWVHLDGQSAVCMPNRTAVVIARG